MPSVLVICNRKDKNCFHCNHSDPHEPEKLWTTDKCTTWGGCHRNDGEYIKVRCTKIKEKICLT